MTVPLSVDLVPRRTLLESLHCCRANVLQVVGAGVGDDGIPNDSLVRLVRVGGWPLSCDIDKKLFRIPSEERREIRLHGELDNGVFLFLGAVVVGTTLDSVPTTCQLRRTM